MDVRRREGRELRRELLDLRRSLSFLSRERLLGFDEGESWFHPVMAFLILSNIRLFLVLVAVGCLLSRCEMWWCGVLRCD